MLESSHDNDPVFGCWARRERTVAYHCDHAGKDEPRLPDFLRFGIRFKPDHSDTDVQRTVVLSNLPARVTLTEVLDKVRGGLVLSAWLMDTLMITGGPSAMVVFLHAFSAEEYAGHVRKHPVRIDGQPVRVMRLSTPTFPVQVGLAVAVREHGQTRCLEIESVTASTADEILKAVGRTLWAVTISVFEWHELRDGVLSVRFTSVSAAGRASGLLRSRAAFKALRIDFAPDPCAQPVGTLAVDDDESDAASAPAQAEAHAGPLDVNAAVKQASSAHFGVPIGDRDAFADDGHGEANQQLSSLLAPSWPGTWAA